MGETPQRCISQQVCTQCTNYNETFVKSIVKLKEKIINLIDLLLVSFVIGYNNLEVAEYLLEKGADVNSRDKGGLIPLHNA